jgi:hypothetical protein
MPLIKPLFPPPPTHQSFDILRVLVGKGKDLPLQGNDRIEKIYVEE